MYNKEYLKKVSKVQKYNFYAGAEFADDYQEHLHNFRVEVGNYFNLASEIYDEEEKVKENWSDLAENAERQLLDYQELVNEITAFMQGIEEQANELGVEAESIGYYQELKYSLSDTKEDEESLETGYNGWKNKSVQ